MAQGSDWLLAIRPGSANFVSLRTQSSHTSVSSRYIELRRTNRTSFKLYQYGATSRATRPPAYRPDTRRLQGFFVRSLYARMSARSLARHVRICCCVILTRMLITDSTDQVSNTLARPTPGPPFFLSVRILGSGVTI